MLRETLDMILTFIPLVVGYGILLDCIFQIPKLIKIYKTEYKPLNIPFKVFANIRYHKMFLDDYVKYGSDYVFSKGRIY